MKNIIETIQGLPGANWLKGVKPDRIKKAEKDLSLSFAEEYKEYLRRFGLLTYVGHELTGIVKSKRLNVVDCTKFERESRDNFPPDIYVIEDTHCEGLVITQDKSGMIYENYPGGKMNKIYNSLAEYISNTSTF